jgi:RecA/RadA recombinase
MTSTTPVKAGEFKSLGLDLDKAVELARSFYPKKEAGLAKQITTGENVLKPTKDEDFVLWTSSPHWQALTGTKGAAFGKLIQISGKTDSGKSTHAMCFMIDAQKQGHAVIFWDAEGKFSPKRYDERMGGKSSQLCMVNTDSIQEGAEAVAAWCKALKQLNPKIKILIVWDSVGASLNSKETQQESEKQNTQPGVDAREIGQAIKKIKKLMFRYQDKESGEHSVACIVVNQVYANIGSVGSVQKGGSQLQYLSSLILEMTRKSDLNRVKAGKKMKYGIVSRARVKKNHLFDGDECVAELELEISAAGIKEFGTKNKKEDGTPASYDDFIEETDEVEDGE